MKRQATHCVRNSNCCCNATAASAVITPIEVSFETIYPSHMKQHSGILQLLIIPFGLLFLGCLSPKKITAESRETPFLTGVWVIVGQTFTPLVIIPICKSIRKGTTVKFTQTTFEVYPDASGKPCNSYAYKSSNNHISFSKADMVWLCTYELTTNILKITSANFFIPDESANPGIANQFPGVKQPVVITLKRK